MLECFCWGTIRWQLFAQEGKLQGQNILVFRTSNFQEANYQTDRCKTLTLNCRVSSSYFSYFFRVLLGTQKHFELLQIRLPVKLISSAKNWNFMSKTPLWSLYEWFSSETHAADELMSYATSELRDALYSNSCQQTNC